MVGVFLSSNLPSDSVEARANGSLGIFQEASRVQNQTCHVLDFDYGYRGRYWDFVFCLGLGSYTGIGYRCSPDIFLFCNPEKRNRDAGVAGPAEVGRLKSSVREGRIVGKQKTLTGLAHKGVSSL